MDWVQKTKTVDRDALHFCLYSEARGLSTAALTSRHPLTLLSRPPNFRSSFLLSLWSCRTTCSLSGFHDLLVSLSRPESHNDFDALHTLLKLSRRTQASLPAYRTI